MTGPTPRPPANPEAPEVILPGLVQAAAGVAVGVPVQIRHRGRIPASMRVTVLGLDSRWIPVPLELGVLQPGEAAEVTLTLVPERGALGARYPFAVAVESTPVRGTAAPIMGVSEAILAVDSAERISMSIQPPTPHAVFGKKFRVEITNPGARDRSFTLLPSAAAGASVRLGQDQVQVPAQRTVTVKGRVRIRRPTVFGGESTHTFAVAAQGVGAPEFAEATVRSQPLVKRGAWMAVSLVLVVALWASLAVVFIPKISDAFKPKSLVGAPSTVTTQGPVAGTGTAAPGGGSNTAPGSGTGGSGNGGSGNGNGAGGSGQGSGASGNQAGYQLTGTVTGPGAKGATVTLAPTSLVGASDVNANAAPGTDASAENALRSSSSGSLAKVPGQVLQQSPADGSTKSVTTGAKGAFAFAGVTSPGYYLLTLAKAGFQTQRFLINSTDLASPQPLKVALQPGTGKLSGKITGPDGKPIGAATIAITDGTVSLQTSSVSQSSAGSHPGTWSMDHLSTPGSYLVTATAPGYGGASTLVTLDPSGKGTANLKLIPGEASIVGTVSGDDELGNPGGLGGITVTATAGKTTRTATTVTSQALRGHYILPSMPTPGEYTLTISGDGYLTQTRTVKIDAGVGSVTVDATLSRADGVVSGIVTGVDANGKSQGGLVGVGLTLTSSTATFKTMTTSGDSAGQYRFTGVPPGTYLLTATQYGRTPASATIEMKAAGSQQQNLVLKESTSTAVPATARIQGVVVDARSQGPLTCDRQEVPNAQKCIITVSLQEPTLSSSGRTGATLRTITSTALPSDPSYQIPSTSGDNPGLTPGLYTLTISAPGYETATTRVEVGQGQTVQAPQVALQPLAIISGTVTTKVGSPATPTCVVVASGSVASADLPTTCVVPDKADSCSVTTPAGARCALVSADGSYQVRGLVHGNYQILVLPTDPEYLPAPASALQIPVGTDGRYDAALDRFGRAQVTVEVPDPATGALSPAGGVKVTVRRMGGAAAPLTPSGTTGSAGTVLLKGLNGTYSVAAQGSSATPTQLSVPLDQTVTATLVVTHPLDPVVGRITTAVDPAINGGSSVAGVDDAVVTITGIVGYQNGSPVYGTAKVTTDSHGCFAIVPPGWSGPALASTGSTDGSVPDCPTVAASATVAMRDSAGADASLVALPITISVADSKKGKAYQANAVIAPGSKGKPDTIPVQVVPAQPTPVVDLKLLAVIANGRDTAPGTPVNNAVITVTKQPAAAGTVTVTANPNGTLNWSDSGLGGNLAVPGVYTLRASLAGYTDAVVDVHCGLGSTSCTFVRNQQFPPPTGAPGEFVLRQYPTFSGDLVTLPTPTDLTSLKFSVTPTPAGTGTVEVKADISGNLSWAESGLPSGLVRPGVPYTITASLQGYTTAQVSVNCTVSSCAPVTVALYQPTTLQMVFVDKDTTHAPPSGVIASVIGDGGSASTTVNSGSSNSVQFFGLAVESSYHFNIQPPGYQFVKGIGNTPFGSNGNQSNVKCSNAAMDALGISFKGFVLLPGGTTTCTVSLTRLGSANVTVQGKNGQWTSLLPNAAVVIQQTADADGNPVTGAPQFIGTTGSDGTVTITGTNQDEGLDAGTYSVSATVPGYQLDPGYQAATVKVIGGESLGDMLSVTVHLEVIPVTVEVHLQYAGTSTDLLPNSYVYLVPYDPSLPLRWCDIDSGALVTGSSSECAINGGDDFLTFDDVNPGSYYLWVFSTDQLVQDVFQTVQIGLSTVGTTQKANVQLIVRASTIQVQVVNPNVLDAQGQPTVVTDAKVSLWSAGGTGPATSVDGTTLQCDASTSPPPDCESGGMYTFLGVKDGTYQAVVDESGYARVVSDPITGNSALDSTPDPYQVKLGAKAQTHIQLPVGSTAASGDLAGATAALMPVTASGDPDTARSPLTGLAITAATGGGFLIDAQGVPVGDWYAVLTGGTNRHMLSNSGDSGTTYYDRTDDFTVKDPPDPANPSTPQTTFAASSYLFEEASATLTAKWTATGTCNSNNPPASGTMQFTITRTSGGTAVFSENVDAAISGGQATASVVLPAGTYTWQPTGLQNGWTGPQKTITVNADGDTASGAGTVTPSTALTSTLASTLVDVTATMTIDGDDASGVGITSTPAAATGSDSQFNNGSATLCVPAGSTTFSVDTNATDPQIALGSQTITVSTTNNSVEFTGFTLQTTVSDNVKGRTADGFARPVDLSLTQTGETGPVWTGGASIPAGSTSVTGPSVVIPSGTGYTLTATPSAGSDTVFSAGSTGPFAVAASRTSPLSKTVTLSYGQTTASVTVRKQGSQLGAGDPAASVTLSSGGSTFGPVQTGNTGTNGEADFVGLSPNTTYTVTFVGTGADADLSGTGTLTTGASGDTSKTVDYGATATITVTKNGNLLTASDPVSQVSLIDGDGDTVATVTTGSTTGTYGKAVFSGLAASTTYTVATVGTGTDANLAGAGTVTTNGAGTDTAAKTVPYGATATITVTKQGNNLISSDPPASVSLTLGGTTIQTKLTQGTDGSTTVSYAIFSGLKANTAYQIIVTGTGTDADLAGTGSVTTGNGGTATATATIAYGATALVSVTKAGSATTDDVTVTAKKTDGTGTTTSCSDQNSDGDYICAGLLAATSYTFTATDGKYSGSTTATTDGQGTDTTAVPTVDMVAPSLTATVKMDGAAVDSITVHFALASAPGTDIGTCKTVTDGTCTLGGLNANTTYTASATYTDSDGNTWTDSNSKKTGGPGSSANVPELDLTAQTTSVQLVVEYGTGGDAVAKGTSVTLKAGTKTFSETTTDADGDVTIGGLAPSTSYAITASYKTGGKTYSVPSPTSVTSPSSGTGAKTTITLAAAP